MAVNVKKSTQSEKEAEQQEVQGKEDKVADDLLSALDLPTFDEEETEGKKVEPLTTPRTEQDDDEEEIEEVEEDDDEEVIPKSKYERKIRASRERERILEARLKELESKVDVKDTRKDRLEKMSSSELKSLKHDAMKQWKVEEDPQRESELVSLMDEIDDISRTGPQRFQQKQAKAYDVKAAELMASPEFEDIDFDKEGEAIKDVALNLYSKHKNLRTMVDGQALALELAVQHYAETRKFSKGKSKVDNLKRQNNKLKRKTSLDTSAVKGSGSSKAKGVSYEKAKASRSNIPKMDYLAGLIDVDKYLPPEHRERK